MQGLVDEERLFFSFGMQGNVNRIEQNRTEHNEAVFFFGSYAERAKVLSRRLAECRNSGQVLRHFTSQAPIV